MLQSAGTIGKNGSTRRATSSIIAQAFAEVRSQIWRETAEFRAAANAAWANVSGAAGTALPAAGWQVGAGLRLQHPAGGVGDGDLVCRTRWPELLDVRCQGRELVQSEH